MRERWGQLMVNRARDVGIKPSDFLKTDEGKQWLLYLITNPASLEGFKRRPGDGLRGRLAQMEREAKEGR